MRQEITGLLAVGLALALGCASSTGTTISINENPGLLVAGVSKTASLVVDGVNMGSAITYSKKKALAVVPGRHVVEVREGEIVVHREEVFVSNGTIRTISVPKQSGGGR